MSDMKFAKELMVLGVIIAAMSIISGSVLAFVGLFPTMQISKKAIPVAGIDHSVKHYFKAGQKIVLYTTGENGPYWDDPPKCTVSGGLATQREAPNTSVTFYDQSHVSFAAYTIQNAGMYFVKCDRPGVIIGPPLSVYGMLGGAVGIFLAFLGGLIGLLILVVGVVMKITS